MILGENRAEVITNIKNATQEGTFNVTVELHDPILSAEEKKEVLENYLKNKGTLKNKVKDIIGRIIAIVGTHSVDRNMQIIGMENIEGIKTGAIITSNHFSPLDSTGPRRLAKEAKKRRLYIVGKESNLAMPGFLGFIMNHVDIIPISDYMGYMKNDFQKLMKEKLDKKKFILIYPEQEMWFNYKKPRPPKLGAYYYAAKFKVPVISCFVELREREEKVTEEFYKVDHVLHILPTIYPDETKSVKENAHWMMEKDYEQKKKAYEDAYGKKLTYDFEPSDIAGLVLERFPDLEDDKVEVGV